MISQEVVEMMFRQASWRRSLWMVQLVMGFFSGLCMLALCGLSTLSLENRRLGLIGILVFPVILLVFAYGLFYSYREFSKTSIVISDQGVKWTNASFTAESQWEDVRIIAPGWRRLGGFCALLELLQPVMHYDQWFGLQFRLLAHLMGLGRIIIPLGGSMWHAPSDLKRAILQHVADPQGLLRSC